MVEWYYAKGDQKRGPVSAAELKRLATEGHLGLDDLVWREGMNEWVPARRVKGLFPPPESTPRTPEGPGTAPPEAEDVPPPPEAAPPAETPHDPTPAGEDSPVFTDADDSSASAPSSTPPPPPGPDDTAEQAQPALGERPPIPGTSAAFDTAQAESGSTGEVISSSEEAVQFTPSSSSPGRGPAAFERSMTAFARAREGATGHLFDKLLSGLRSAFGEEFIGGTTWLFATCGKYGLLVGATLLLVYAIVGAAVAYTLVPLGLGVAGAATLVILQYVSGRLLTVLDRWHRSIRVRLGSSALPDSVALAGILFALVALVGFTVLGVQSGELWLILLGVASFMGAAFLGIVALNAEKMGMDVVSESGPAQEGLALGVFALKSMAVLTPVVFGSAVLLGSLQVLVAIAILSAAAVGGGQTDLGTQPAAASEDVDILDDETGTIQTAAVQPVNNGASEPVFDALVALAMLWTGTLFLLIGGLIPLAAYLLFMLGYVILAVIQAILVLPGRMHNPERDRSDTAG